MIAGFGAAIVVLGLASTGARAKASAERVALLLDVPGDVPPVGARGASAPSSTSG
jgi:hypothetical protein